MAERKNPCPHCERPIGGTHNDFCPRSRVQKRALRGPSGGHMAFMSKGMSVVPDETGSPRIVTNPGFPYVKKGKSWLAGGLPLGFDRETALAYVKEKANVPAFRQMNTLTPKETE